VREGGDEDAHAARLRACFRHGAGAKLRGEEGEAVCPARTAECPSPAA
jgi:hypothetical protein